MRRLTNRTGLSVSLLPNGCLFAIEHRDGHGTVMISQVLGSPLAGGIGRVLARVGRSRGRPGKTVEAVGPGARVRLGAGKDRCVWEGETEDLAHRVTLWLAPAMDLWLWQVEVSDRSPDDGRSPPRVVQAMLVQDVGLGERGFLMRSEAFASQYIDHHIARHDRLGPVILSRQALAQQGRYPWAAHGCLEGAAGFATDAAQLFGPRFRDASEVFAAPPSVRLQHEVACPALAGPPRRLRPGETAAWTFFGLFLPDHPAPSGPADLAGVEAALAAAAEFHPERLTLAEPARSLMQTAAPLVADDLEAETIARLWPERRQEERDAAGSLLSFFVPEGPLNRHVVLREKERSVRRRHGALLRSGRSLLPDERALCATAWAHGVFAAQLTIGNTAFHKLFSVSRDPYNITRASGLRLLVELGEGWRLLAVPSAFEMGVAECRWLYQWDGRAVTVRAAVSGEEPAIAWQVRLEGTGPACRFLVVGHLVLGEREWEQAGRVEVDAERRRVAFRPDPDSLWGRRYPQAVYHLLTPAPGAVEALGGDELLYQDGQARGGACVALRTRPVTDFAFAVTGSLTDAAEAAALADRYAAGMPLQRLQASAEAHWTEVTRGLRVRGGGAGADAIDTAFPWLAHDAMMHLSVPHGLEQYTAAAWGTRDVCQGPIEFLLALEHDDAVRAILRILFAQQYEQRGDWPQWFMLDPYAVIQEPQAHGDVLVWPLKALCDYLEATGDLAFLDEPVAWRRDTDFERTARQEPIAAHVETLLAAVRRRFIPGTHLLRYGEGDWNDALQPVDPALRDWMVSTWTIALLLQQFGRYGAILERAGRGESTRDLAALATAMRADLHRHLMRDGVLAGYAVFRPEGGPPELLLHPTDRRTGVRYSLLPMTRALIAGLLDPPAAHRHLELLRAHLLFPDGARLMDRPIGYRGGSEQLFRRAESAAYFGREIGLMYTHAHLRYGEAMAALGEADLLWQALLVANPIAVTDVVPNAAPRQRNAYFSSSDATFPDRYAASREWERVKAGEVAVEGGWRIYSSGPGLYVSLLVRHVLGLRRRFGERVHAPLLPRSHSGITVESTLGGARRREAPEPGGQQIA